jgi:hypothetical protein
MPVNAIANGRELEFLTKGIAAAISRSRLTTNSLEAIAAALRHKEATVPEVIDWLKDEGLFELVSRHTFPGDIAPCKCHLTPRMSKQSSRSHIT